MFLFVVLGQVWGLVVVTRCVFIFGVHEPVGSRHGEIAKICKSANRKQDVSQKLRERKHFIFHQCDSPLDSTGT